MPWYWGSLQWMLAHAYESLGDDLSLSYVCALHSVQSSPLCVLWVLSIIPCVNNTVHSFLKNAPLSLNKEVYFHFGTNKCCLYGCIFGIKHILFLCVFPVCGALCLLSTTSFSVNGVNSWHFCTFIIAKGLFVLSVLFFSSMLDTCIRQALKLWSEQCLAVPTGCNRHHLPAYWGWWINARSSA